MKLISCKRCGTVIDYHIVSNFDSGDRRVKNEIYEVEGKNWYQCAVCFHRNGVFMESDIKDVVES